MCNCNFCKAYKKYKWAVILQCGCGCHKSNGMDGHDNLCCKFPNGLIKNNPYKKLKPVSYYKEIMDSSGDREAKAR